MYNFLGDVFVLQAHPSLPHVKKDGYHASLPEKPGLWRLVEK